MRTIPKQELARITQSVEIEFPDDRALQQVHIARKVIAYEAAAKGLTFMEYVGSSRERRRPGSRRRRIV
jgi:hypothetical protein